MLKPIAMSYDRIMRSMEDAGLSVWRREILSELRGDVLEIGAGTGRSLTAYPDAVTSLTLAEPDRNMRSQLHKAAAALEPPEGGRPVRIVDSPAECLPFEDQSFDAAVSSLVLCSVRDQAKALKELHRVLRPQGVLAFVEHVAAHEKPERLKWQRRIEPIWRFAAGNCHLTRDTETAIEASGFEVIVIERASLRGAPPFVRPSIRGTAFRSSAL